MFLMNSFIPQLPKQRKVVQKYGSFDSYWFRKQAYSSLYFIQRLELAEKLEEHGGCVNCLNFSSSGDLLVSGSDDLEVCIWDWAAGRIRTKYNSGHSSNVFQAKFCLDNTKIVTCSRDGQVRLSDIASSNSDPSKKIATHRAPAHKLTLSSARTVLSCGEDAVVNEVDLRLERASKLLVVK